MRHRLRVAVDHDGLEAGLLQRIGGVDAAIVELDALADAVRAAAEDDDLLAVGRVGLALGRRRSRPRRSNTCRAWPRRTRRRRCRCACRPGSRRGRGAAAATSASVHAGQLRQPRVGEAHRLQPAQRLARPRAGRTRRTSLLGLDDASRSRAGTRGRTCRRRGSPRPPGRRASPGRPSAAGPASGGDRAARITASGASRSPGDLDLVEAGQPGLHRRAAPSAAPRRSCGRSPSPRRPTSSGGQQSARRAGELLEGEARDLDDDVVDRRLEAGRRDPGDVVGQLVQRVADRELGGDLGDREAGRLRRQRRGARRPAGSSRSRPCGRRRG